MLLLQFHLRSDENSMNVNLKPLKAIQCVVLVMLLECNPGKILIEQYVGAAYDLI